MLDLIVDANNLLMRSVYAARSRSRTSGTPTAQMSANGEPTAALVIFMGMMSSYVRMIEPDRMLVAFDSHADLWRTAYMPTYKAGRDRSSERDDVPMDQVKELLGLLEVPQSAREGFEADDLIAASCELSRSRGSAVVILSGDKDLFQLLRQDEVVQIRPGTGDDEWWDCQRVTEQFVPPERYAAYLALAGDPGDGIPGVAGIGPVKAKALIAEHSGPNKELKLPTRWDTSADRGDYLNSLKVADLRDADWDLMGLEPDEADVYPSYPQVGPGLEHFLSRYSLRSLTERVEKGVLWRDRFAPEAEDLVDHLD